MGRVLFSGSHVLSRCSPAPYQESLGYANVSSGAELNDPLTIHQEKLQHHHVETVVLSLPCFWFQFHLPNYPNSFYTASHSIVPLHLATNILASHSITPPEMILI